MLYITITSLCGQESVRCGVVVCTLYITITSLLCRQESVRCGVVAREPTAVVQLQFSRHTLLVACRGRSCLLTWPPETDGAEPQLRQVGAKPRKRSVMGDGLGVRVEGGGWGICAVCDQ